MAEQKYCQDCIQKHNCQQIYEKLANTKGRSVVFKAVAAFLLPILVFIITLVIFEKILSGFEMAAGWRAIFSTAASLLVTIVFVLIIKASKRTNKFGS